MTPLMPNGYTGIMGTRALETRDALAAALVELGCTVAEEPPYLDRCPDLVVSVPNGAAVTLEVKAVGRLDPAAVQRLRTSAPHQSSVAVLVADRISEAARVSLSDKGFSWFDRRGHLRLVAPGILIDTDTPPSKRFTEARADGIKGKAGMAYAVASLLSPQERPTVRGVAREAGLSAPSVSVAAASLRRAALVDNDGRPLLPDLFWTLAEQWKPTFVRLGGGLTSTLSGQADRLGVFGDPSVPGWALTGTVAAYAWSAPLVAPTDLPPEFYVPDSRTLALRAASSVSRRPASTRVRSPLRQHPRPVCPVTISPRQERQRSGISCSPDRSSWPLSSPTIRRGDADPRRLDA